MDKEKPQIDPYLNSIANYTITIILTTLVIIVTYFKMSYRYWYNRNLPYLEPSIPFGNSQNPLKRTMPIAHRLTRYYQSFKQRGHKHGGIYLVTKPIYIPADPEYIKNVLAKDFQHFVDRGGYYNEKTDPLSAHLFNLEGEKWKQLRMKLTPTFTSGKIKTMFTTLLDCGVPMAMHIDKYCESKEAMDVKSVLSSFTTDVIGSCAFGIDCNSFTNPDSEFTKFGRKIFRPNKFVAGKAFLSIAFPGLAKALNMVIIPKDISEFYLDVVKKTVDYREANKVSRNDFMQLLLEMKTSEDKQKNTDNELNSLTLNQISAQAFMFFLAGYETSSTTLTFCFLELAKNQDIQQKVRDEINQILAKYDNKITYDGIMEMKYMNQVIEETLRKYPPVVLLARTCVKNYKIPETDVTLEKGTNVFVPVYAIHHDPEFYPNPELFDPDRFTEENKAKRPQFTYLPFGEGPRICIGVRFGMLESKVGLALILKDFKVMLNEQTKYPIEFDMNSFVLSSKETILLDVERL